MPCSPHTPVHSLPKEAPELASLFDTSLSTLQLEVTSLPSLLITMFSCEGTSPSASYSNTLVFCIWSGQRLWWLLTDIWQVLADLVHSGLQEHNCLQKGCHAQRLQRPPYIKSQPLHLLRAVRPESAAGSAENSMVANMRLKNFGASTQLCLVPLETRKGSETEPVSTTQTIIPSWPTLNHHSVTTNNIISLAQIYKEDL